MKRHYIYGLLFILIVCCDVGLVFSNQTLQGTVVRVIDGDSILLKQGRRTHEIRLWGIDCPEYDQPYASKSKKISTKLLKGKTVTVEVKTRDRYDRVVGVVYAGNLNVNEELVRCGAAWVYSRYCREAVCRKWKKSEREAKEDNSGLWNTKNAVAPWQWRRAKR